MALRSRCWIRYLLTVPIIASIIFTSEQWMHSKQPSDFMRGMDLKEWQMENLPSYFSQDGSGSYFLPVQLYGKINRL